MNILVTGAAGFIGSTFVAQRLALGNQVVVLDALTYAGHMENLDWISPRENLTIVVGDIGDEPLVESLLRKHDIDSLVNFAAESHVDNSISGPAVFIQTNVFGTFSLLQAARAYWGQLEGKKKDAFRYLQVSTDEVYGSLPFDESIKFSEQSPYKPNSPYSSSKAAGDHLTRAWHETYGLPTILTNCTNNYGPRQHPEKLIPTIITSALAGKPLPIYGDGQNVRDWIHVEDHCRGVALALTRGEAGSVYCLGGAAEKNNIAVVDAICDVLDSLRPRADGKSYREQKTFVKDRLGHDRRYAMDDTHAQQALGFTRQHNFASGLRATVEWYLANEEWIKAVTTKKPAA